MLNVKEKMKKVLGNDPMPKFYKMYFYIKSHKGLIKYFYYYRLKKMYEKYNCGIPISADLKRSTQFPHGLNGIWISSGAKIGENCVIFHQVTIGSNTLKDSKGSGSPEIGNNVYIGAGAKIIRKSKNRK